MAGRDRPGRPFLQIPGPTLVPERIVRAMAQPIIDHRGPKFSALVHECLDGLKTVFQTRAGHIVLYPGSGTGAWEAALVNTLSPGDRVLACVNGHFSNGFARTAAAYGIDCERLELAYGDGVPAGLVEEHLRRDQAREIRAVLVVHNETSTGVTSDIPGIRAAVDRAGHPALLLVDTVSSLASIDFRLDEWGVDVALTGPQKGLMLPPGMAILAVSERAVAASEKARCPRAYWDWQPVLDRNRRGEYPYTPATVLLFGLREAIAMLTEEGLGNVFARHRRLAEACRRAVRGMGLEILCRNPAEYSSTLTAVIMPPGLDSDAFIQHASRRLDMSLGIGLGAVKGKVFRIGHLGSLNELDLLGGLAGVEMMLKEFGVPVTLGRGLGAAQEFLLASAPPSDPVAATPIGPAPAQ
jgi:alanine-glyoxylate transaminase/serine-glyoxylate transaminase/serine-pyruvate transaminase